MATNVSADCHLFIAEVAKRLKFFICWFWDRSDGIFIALTLTCIYCIHPIVFYWLGFLRCI